MSLAKLSLLLLAPLASAEDDAVDIIDDRTCEVQQNRSMTNCWGHDLTKFDRPGESWEDCCQACADIPKCTVFTFDIWNNTGLKQNYCFFKSNCSDTRHSDTAISGINPHIKPTPPPPTPTPEPTPTPLPTLAPENKPQCQAPKSTVAMGSVHAEPLNVSARDDCCHRCVAPNCTYVTFGQYENSTSWACFLHKSKTDASALQAAPVMASLARRLSGASAAARSCADLGLTGCQGADVQMPPPPLPAQVPTPWLVGAGVVAFFFAMLLGFGFSRRLQLATRLTKASANGRDPEISLMQVQHQQLQ